MSYEKGYLSASVTLTPQSGVELSMTLAGSLMIRIDAGEGIVHLYANVLTLEMLADSLATVAAYAALPNASKGRVTMEAMEAAVADSLFVDRINMQQGAAGEAK